MKVEGESGLAEQIEKQRLSLRIRLAASTNMSEKGAAFQESGQSSLVDQREVVVDQVLEPLEFLQHVLRHHDVAHAQGGEQQFAAGPDVNDAIVPIETLQAGQRRSVVTELGIVVVFHD